MLRVGSGIAGQPHKGLKHPTDRWSFKTRGTTRPLSAVTTEAVLFYNRNRGHSAPRSNKPQDFALFEAHRPGHPFTLRFQI